MSDKAAKSGGAVVTSLQQVLSNGASGQWNTSPGAIDGNFGPATAASVKAFQTWGGVTPDELSAIKRGRFRCTRRARHWKALSVYNMPSDV